MKKMTVLMLVMLMLCHGFVCSASGEMVNIASMGKTSVSSTYLTMVKENVVDGNKDSSWSNGYYPNAPNYFRLDFDFPIPIAKISLNMWNYSNYNSDFEVRVSATDPFKDYERIANYGTGEHKNDAIEYSFTDGKTYSSILVIGHSINGTLGISELEVYVDGTYASVKNVSANKKVSGGKNMQNFSATSLVDTNKKSVAAMQYEKPYIDIDLGKRFSLLYAQLTTVDSSYGGNRKCIRLLGTNSEGFTDETDITEIYRFDDDMTAETTYGMEISGTYRYIRIISDSEEFTPIAELSLYAPADDNFERWIVRDSAGNEITDAKGKKAATVEINVKAMKTSGYMAIAMLYDKNGTMVNCNIKKISAIGNCVIDVSDFADPSDGYVLRGVLIDGLNDRISLCGKTEMEW